jgi:hypothetical protein
MKQKKLAKMNNFFVSFFCDWIDLKIDQTSVRYYLVALNIDIFIAIIV